MIAKASRRSFINIVRAVSLSAAKSSLRSPHWAFQRASVDGRHRHCVHTRREFQCMQRDRIELILAGQQDVELSLFVVRAIVAIVRQHHSFRGIFLIYQRHLTGSITIDAYFVTPIVIWIRIMLGVHLKCTSRRHTVDQRACSRISAHSSTNVEIIRIILLNL